MSKSETSKSRSRGISCDMSPEAIARRIDLVSELREFSLFLADAGKASKGTLSEKASKDPAKKEKDGNKK